MRRIAIATAVFVLATPAVAQTPPEQARDAAWNACRSVIGGGPSSAMAIPTALKSAWFVLNPSPDFRTGYGWSDGRSTVTVGYDLAGGLRETGECVVSLIGLGFGSATRAAARDFAVDANATETANASHAFLAEWEEAYEVITLDALPGGGWRLRIGVPAGGWREGAA